MEGPAEPPVLMFGPKVVVGCRACYEAWTVPARHPPLAREPYLCPDCLALARVDAACALVAA